MQVPNLLSSAEAASTIRLSLVGTQPKKIPRSWPLFFLALTFHIFRLETTLSPCALPFPLVHSLYQLIALSSFPTASPLSRLLRPLGPSSSLVLVLSHASPLDTIRSSPASSAGNEDIEINRAFSTICYDLSRGYHRWRSMVAYDSHAGQRPSTTPSPYRPQPAKHSTTLLYRSQQVVDRFLAASCYRQPDGFDGTLHSRPASPRVWRS